MSINLQTRSLGNLNKDIAALAGVGDFTQDEQININQFINRRYLIAYNASPAWPRFLRNGEKRYVTPRYVTVSGITLPNMVNDTYELMGKTRSNSSGNIDDAEYPIWRNMNGGRSYIFLDQNNYTNQIAYIASSANLIDTTYGSYDAPDRNVYVESHVSAFTRVALASGFSSQLDARGKFTANPFIATDADKSVGDWTASGLNTGTVKTETEGFTVPYRAYGGGTNDTYEMGEIFRIYDKPPRLKNSVREYNFVANPYGAQLIDFNADTSPEVYVDYKIAWEPLDTVVGANRLTSSIPVPLEFYNFIAHGSYADFLRMDGQVNKATVEDEVASQFLINELEKVDIISNRNNVTSKFSTYVNNQSRSS
jgi:hypothetical protein